MIVASATINADRAEEIPAALEELARKLRASDSTEDRTIAVITDHTVATLTWGEEE